ncbi:MAG: hypothetical protein HYT71_03010 [Candidatus Aenigmarchaeota archaeon]|nr:hypothetical protein [Candidatus Aenigmarchaeota archaeon]
MQAYDNVDKTDLYTYARRFEPVAFKSGRPKIWAAMVFDEEISQRFCELQGYVSRSAKERNVKSHETGYTGRGLSVETGTLWTPVITSISMDTTGDLKQIGPLMDAYGSDPQLNGCPEKKSDKTYLLATHLSSESVIIPGKKPLTYSEMEIYLISNTEEFCQDIMEILETGLPDGILTGKPKRLNITANERNEFYILYNDEPFIGKTTVVSRVRFG